MIQKIHPLSKLRRCELLNISRSSIYYQPKSVSDTDQTLMKLIDETHTAKSFLGSRRIVDSLADDHNQVVNRKRVSRLMKVMGIQAIYPKPRTTQSNPQHKVYPYLLRNMNIDQSNQVWATDITYIPMAKGFIYLTVIMDWYSRKVLSWRLSNSMDTSFCIDALEEAIYRYGRPIIFNTDQGSQYTSEAFTQVLKDNDIRISMDGKGAWRDNVFVERLWRSVKYEEVYLNAYESMSEAKQSLQKYFKFYNQNRKHQTLKAKPDQVYYESIKLPKAA
jgi:putative transposase